MAQFTQPLVGSSVTVAVSSSQWMSVGQVVYHSNGGYYRVMDKPSAKSVTIANLGYPGNANALSLVENTGAQISPGGIIGPTPEHAVERRTLTDGDVSNGYITISEDPKDSGELQLLVSGGPALLNGVDFSVEGRNVTWSGYSLEGLLSVGDELTMRYAKSYVYP